MVNILWFEDITLADMAAVGGKNASLGEMVSHLSAARVRVPGGFVTTADAYRTFLAEGGLDQRIWSALEALEIDDVGELARVGAQIGAWIQDQPLSEGLEHDIRAAYTRLIARDPDPEGVTWAIRSSATAEDLPDASFAGQQETYLNIGGVENLLSAIRRVFASLYNDRAIAYRVHHGFAHHEVALSAGIQRMVRSDIGTSGVMFTVDTETGFEEAVFITSAYGLGEAVVQGVVNPDEFYVYKPGLRRGDEAILSRTLGEKAVAMRYSSGLSLESSTVLEDVPSADRSRFSITDAEVMELGRCALAIEDHYGRPMDVEWARDGVDGRIYILQARPETVVSHTTRQQLRRFVLHGRGKVLTSGRAIGQRIGAGPVRVLRSPADMHLFQPGEVLVAEVTDPDWEPIMKRASAIVTERGGRTCHAAILARELGLPAVVGTGDATTILADGHHVTVSCTEGDNGMVYAGALPFEEVVTDLDQLPVPPVKIMMNVGTPDRAFSFSQLPHHGVGLARMEFIINHQIGVHPRALLARDALPDQLGKEIDRRVQAYGSPREFFVRRVAEGVSTIAASFAPERVIVRFSDFKTNEYARLLGGELYEPQEENPMLGYRGASRYLSEDFRECFAMECQALRFVREEMGLQNVAVMVPFVRTVEEARGVVELLASHGLRRGEDGLEVMMMCEVPSNVLLADEFLEHFDGFSIGSNDLTQLVLGVDRGSDLVSYLFDERDPAVLKMLTSVIDACRSQGKYVGICGQGPSDHPDLARWLVAQGIESISLTPDTVVQTWVDLTRKADR
ncbi:phosphoenolpyruvate synthase [Nesterenkonia sp. E16_7]|uniref:phosphoenolpyruvate synthase n=1 Tax=unclassified Nesterenkonia TaxID=2629769 RepID=UPI001A92C7D2|nr:MULTISPECIES: phosphoenolpyruvate synthase [unclassified Nesterenkonia]MBO0595937.1 phosphoenolpyruvate synthase [Nesterenkonia sp. E16_10]MBO0599463.1 phosphoenolpyruvate synthase [Nesterenkonia sp. E16_7]